MQFVAIDPVNFASAKHIVTVVPLDSSLPRWTNLTGAEFAGMTDGAKSAILLSNYSPYAYFRVPLERDQTNVEPSASEHGFHVRITTIAIPQAGGTYLPRMKGLIGEGTLNDLAEQVRR